MRLLIQANTSLQCYLSQWLLRVWVNDDVNFSLPNGILQFGKYAQLVHMYVKQSQVANQYPNLGKHANGFAALLFEQIRDAKHGGNELQAAAR